MTKQTELKLNDEILQAAKLDGFKFIAKLAELPYVKTIYLFGSRARGDFHDKSDIDLAIVYLGDDVMHRRIVKAIIDDVADTFLHIDLVDYNDISEEFKSVIDKEKVVIYED